MACCTWQLYMQDTAPHAACLAALNSGWSESLITLMPSDLRQQLKHCEQSSWGHAIRRWKHYPLCSTLEQFLYHFLSVQWNEKQTFKQALWSSPEAALLKHCLDRHHGILFCFLKICSSYFYKPFFPLCLRNHFCILYAKILAKIVIYIASWVRQSTRENLARQQKAPV